MADKKILLVADGDPGDPIKVPQRLKDQNDGTYAPLVNVASIPPSSATVASVTTTTSSTTVLAANANRKGATFNSVSGTILLKLGTGASATSYSARLVTNAYYELPNPTYTGVITAIGAGTLLVTEIS